MNEKRLQGVGHFVASQGDGISANYLHTVWNDVSIPKISFYGVCTCKPVTLSLSTQKGLHFNSIQFHFSTGLTPEGAKGLKVLLDARTLKYHSSRRC